VKLLGILYLGVPSVKSSGMIDKSFDLMGKEKREKERKQI
jgi:hypothetical protein